jgi:sodium-dependent dicarboxylate transporter 2/3/5
MVGDRASLMVGTFIGITAFLGMWISNTATAAMMLPIALSLTACAGAGPERGEDADPLVSNYRVALLLGLAYGASLGGVAILVGTPPNLFLASFAREQMGVEIGFARWLVMGCR